MGISNYILLYLINLLHTHFPSTLLSAISNMSNSQNASFNAGEAKAQAEEKTSQMSEKAGEKTSQMSEKAGEKTSQVSDMASEKSSQASDMASEKTSQAGGMLQSAKESVQETGSQMMAKAGGAAEAVKNATGMNN